MKTAQQAYKEAYELFGVENLDSKFYKNSTTITEDELIELQDLCSCNLSWSTNLSIIDCADLLVNSALENGNIKKD